MILGNVVGLLGGPGIGKSTLAANLYVELKHQHIDVEYVNEYPKELVYQNNLRALQDQVYVFAHQYYKIITAAEHNKIVITDSPILLSAVYNPDTSKHFTELVIELHNKFNSLNVVLKRNPETHSMIGRVHSLTQSISIDNRIRSILTERNIDYLEFDPITDDIKKLALLVRQEFGV
jgi:nicotinamide riboside kinase